MAMNVHERDLTEPYSRYLSFGIENLLRRCHSFIVAGFSHLIIFVSLDKCGIEQPHFFLNLIQPEQEIFYLLLNLSLLCFSFKF